MKLSKSLTGVKLKITKLKMPNAEKSRLVSLGLEEDNEIVIENFSFFGGSMLVKTGNLRIVMRTELAEKIEVENA